MSSAAGQSQSGSGASSSSASYSAASSSSTTVAAAARCLFCAVPLKAAHVASSNSEFKGGFCDNGCDVKFGGYRKFLTVPWLVRPAVASGATTAAASSSPTDAQAASSSSSQPAPAASAVKAATKLTAKQAAKVAKAQAHQDKTCKAADESMESKHSKEKVAQKSGAAAKTAKELDEALDPHFSTQTIDIIAHHADYTCCKCQNKQLVTKEGNGRGTAAHIEGAKSGSARFDPNMTNAQRSHHSNGLWLCKACHDEVDRLHPNVYPVSVLRDLQSNAHHKKSKRWAQYEFNDAADSKFRDWYDNFARPCLDLWEVDTPPTLLPTRSLSLKRILIALYDTSVRSRDYRVQLMLLDGLTWLACLSPTWIAHSTLRSEYLFSVLHIVALRFQEESAAADWAPLREAYTLFAMNFVNAGEYADVVYCSFARTLLQLDYVDHGIARSMAAEWCDSGSPEEVGCTIVAIMGEQQAEQQSVADLLESDSEEEEDSQ